MRMIAIVVFRSEMSLFPRCLNDCVVDAVVAGEDLRRRLGRCRRRRGRWVVADVVIVVVAVVQR